MLELNKVPFSTYKRFPGLVKSVPLVVKCFPIRDPFAPLVDLGWPSQARATKIHAWCKWITHGKTFHYSGNWFHSGNTFTVEKRNIDFIISLPPLRAIENFSNFRLYNLLHFWKVNTVFENHSKSLIFCCNWKFSFYRENSLLIMWNQ